MANSTTFVNNAQEEMKNIMNLIYEAENRAGDLLKKYQRLGYNAFTDTHFFEEDGATPKQGLNYTKDEFSTAIGNLEQIARITEIIPADNVFLTSILETIVKITN